MGALLIHGAKKASSEIYVESRNTFYSPPELSDSDGLTYYLRKDTLKDGRVIKLCFYDFADDRHVTAGDLLGVKVDPSASNRNGFFASETFFNGPDEFVTFQPDLGRTYCNFKMRHFRIIDTEKVRLVGSKENLSDSELDRMFQNYETFLSQVVQVVKGRRKSLTASIDLWTDRDSNPEPPAV